MMAQRTSCSEPSGRRATDRNGSAKEASGQVYVFRAGSLGDALVSLPAWQEICRRHPDRPIHLLTPAMQIPGIPDTATVYRMTGRLGEVIYYETSRDGLRGVARRTREIGVGPVYCLMPERPTWAHLRDYAFLRGVLRLRPHGIFTAIFGNLLKRPFRPADFPAMKEWKRLLACAGNATDELDFPLLPPVKTAEDVAEQLVSDLGGHRFLVACPGSKMPAKRWPVENYREVFRRFCLDHPRARIVLLGSPSERELCDQVAAIHPDRIFNRAGDFSLEESAAVCRRALCYFGNDTGAMHLAAAMGTPCIAIFSARDRREKWEPYGNGHIVLREHVACAGCMLQECNVHRLQCLTRISPLSAYHALDRVWGMLARADQPHNHHAAQDA